MRNALRIMLVALMMAFVTTASAMSYRQARRQALFLADKMAYELKLSNRQYEAVYRINLDYLMAVNNRRDVFGNNWARRNYELKRTLSHWQYNRYVAANYFYRPVYWSNNNWRWRIYNRYSSDRWYYSRPSSYSSSYSYSSCNSDCDYDDCGYDCDDCDYDDCDDCDYNDRRSRNSHNSNYNSNYNNNVNVINVNNSVNNRRPRFRFW